MLDSLQPQLATFFENCLKIEPTKKKTSPSLRGSSTQQETGFSHCEAKRNRCFSEDLRFQGTHSTTWLAQPPSSCLAGTLMRCRACACITTAQDQSAVVGFINRLPSLHRNTAAYYHRADHSRRTQPSVSHFVTTVIMLT